MSYTSIAGIGFDSWVRTVRGNPWRSIHFYVLIVFDFNAALGALHCCRVWPGMEYRDTALAIAILLTAVVLYANYLLYSLYAETRRTIFGGSVQSDAQNVVLAATHVAYRMCLIAIGAIGCCLQLIALYGH